MTEEVNGTYVTDRVPKVGRIHGHLRIDVGAIPKGSTWARNPVPDYGSEFQAICKGIPNCDSTGSGVNTRCRCTGKWGPYDLEIVGQVIIPKHLKPGGYILSWRCRRVEPGMELMSDVAIVGKKEAKR